MKGGEAELAGEIPVAVGWRHGATGRAGPIGAVIRLVAERWIDHQPVGDDRGGGPADGDAQRRRRDKDHEIAAVEFAPIGPQAEQVRHHEDRQQETGRMDRRRRQRQHRHAQHADYWQAALRGTDEDGGDQGNRIEEDAAIHRGRP